MSTLNQPCVEFTNVNTSKNEFKTPLLFCCNFCAIYLKGRICHKREFSRIIFSQIKVLKIRDSRLEGRLRGIYFNDSIFGRNFGGTHIRVLYFLAYILLLWNALFLNTLGDVSYWGWREGWGGLQQMYVILLYRNLTFILFFFLTIARKM